MEILGILDYCGEVETLMKMILQRNAFPKLVKFFTEERSGIRGNIFGQAIAEQWNQDGEVSVTRSSGAILEVATAIIALGGSWFGTCAGIASEQTFFCGWR